MMTEVLVLDPPTASPCSALGSLPYHRSQLQGPPQVPPLEEAEGLRQDIAIDGERDIGSAS